MILGLSIVLLVIGAELVLDASEKVGKLFNIPPLVIGLVLIGLGTSLPEFFVSHLAAINGQGDMAIGNIVGSNISNLMLVLGISVLIHKIVVDKKEVINQAYIHVGLSITLSIILMFNKLYALSCLVLLTFFLGHLFFTYLGMNKQKRNPLTLEELEDVEDLEYTAKAKIILFVKLLVGFGFLYYGGEYLVKSGTEICRLSGISEYLVSAIFIALGTSIPELITSLLAAFKKKNVDLIFGNVIGSNIFNVAFVMGSLLFYEIDLKRTFYPEIIVLNIASLAVGFYAFKKIPLGKSIGFSLIGLYCLIVYTWIQYG